MPLGRLLCAVLIAFPAAAARSDERGARSGGGGGAPPSLASVSEENPNLDPSAAGDEDCAADSAPPETDEPRPDAVRLEICLISKKARAYADWTSYAVRTPAQVFCGLSAPVLERYKRWANEASKIGTGLAARFPRGTAALREDRETFADVFADLSKAEANGRTAAARIGLFAGQCAYGQGRLNKIRGEKTVAGLKQRLRGGLDDSKLDATFDNSRPRPGLSVWTPENSAPGPAGLTPVKNSGVKGKSARAPLETFESLTAGIIYESGPEAISKRERRKRIQLLNQALRHIYSIPEGKKVLRDIQTVRRLKGEELQAQRPEIKAQAERRLQDLKTLERALAVLKNDAPVPEPDGPRLLEERSLDSGEIDRVNPYRALDACPPGQRPVVVNYPNPGDRFCRPETDAPGLYLASKDKKDDFTPGEKRDRCPDGHTPVLTMQPKAGDRSCRPPDDADLVKSIGPGPYFYIATNDPFQPFKILDRCPARSEAVVINWPQPGDFACLGAGSFGSVSEVNEKIAETRKKAAIDEIWLAAADKTAKPRVGVEFGGTDELEGGHAMPTQYRLMKYEDGSASFTTPVRISKEFLEDRNPSRAVDKVLIHELRHTADKGMFEAAGASQTRWLLGEDRAYLSQARAVMEQQPAMRRERTSGIVAAMKVDIVESTLLNPKAVRLDRLTSPLYLWHVSHADFQDPQTGLQGRLEQAYGMLDGADRRRRAAIFSKIDAAGELEAAYQKTVETENASEEQRRALFLDLASKTRLAQRWLDGLERLKTAPPKDGRPPAWKSRFDAMEDEYWRDLESFTARYKRR